MSGESGVLPRSELQFGGAGEGKLHQATFSLAVVPSSDCQSAGFR